MIQLPNKFQLKSVLMSDSEAEKQTEMFNESLDFELFEMEFCFFLYSAKMIYTKTQFMWI